MTKCQHIAAITILMAIPFALLADTDRYYSDTTHVRSEIKEIEKGCFMDGDAIIAFDPIAENLILSPEVYGKDATIIDSTEYGSSPHHARYEVSIPGVKDHKIAVVRRFADTFKITFDKPGSKKGHTTYKTRSFHRPKLISSFEFERDEDLEIKTVSKRRYRSAFTKKGKKVRKLSAFVTKVKRPRRGHLKKRRIKDRALRVISIINDRGNIRWKVPFYHKGKKLDLSMDMRKYGKCLNRAAGMQFSKKKHQFLSFND
ncbi:MAG: hypothetical protein HOE90_06650 [Bacteriovoracaceae bacterium]|jgi:hypothetical protein|nr:hypothetical protein [Bacteriovoracaceae bacterium]